MKRTAWAILAFVVLAARLPGGQASGAATPAMGDSARALGVDADLWQGVRNRTPLEAADRRAFYELLRVVGRYSPREMLHLAGEPTPLAPLFNDPDRQFGRLVNLEGVVRRVTRIRVDDPELRREYGFDHYYQVELFPADSQNNPLVCCLRTVPEGSERPPRHETWQVAGVFLKVWAYRAQATGAGAANVRLAPLVIGPGALRVVDAEPASREGLRTAVAILILAGLGLAWALVWRRGDRAARRKFAELRGDGARPRETGT